MTRFFLLPVFVLALTLLPGRADDAQAQNAPNHPRVDHARFFPAAGKEQAMVGGKFEGSNVSERDGYETLAQIADVPPANQWTEIKFDHPKYYRWYRYLAPPGSHGNVAEVEFYAGSQKLGFGRFGSLGHVDTAAAYGAAMDGKTDTFFNSSVADGQYVGTDCGYWSDDQPNLSPAPTVPPPFRNDQPAFKLNEKASQITLTSSSPHAVIRYSFEGVPGPNEGTVYSGPIPLTQPMTVFAVAYRDGFAPSPITSGTYFTDPPKPGLTTLHIGNSLTSSSMRFITQALTAGWQHDGHYFTLGGAPTWAIWDKYVQHPDDVGGDKVSWNQVLALLPKLDDFTLQVQEVDMAREAAADIKFLDLLRQKFPDAQPWLYCVWTESYKPPRAVTLGQEPSFQMKTVVAPLTWEESAGSQLLYVEDVRTKIEQTDQGGKKLLVLPNAIAAARLKNAIDDGKIPGLAPGDFWFIQYNDNYHPGSIGVYLLDMVWYAAFYHESPVGKVLPVGETNLSPEQAAAIQAIAWDVAQNYPDFGFFQEGTDPVGAPQVANSTKSYADDAPINASIWTPPTHEDSTPVTLSSATPGAWFRYTLDGTEPTRTNGYVYCGVISVRPGMTLKAIAYKTGMADSTVTTQAYPAK